MDKIVRELNELRITTDEAARNYQHTVNETSTRERTLLDHIQLQQQQNNQFSNNTRKNRHNPIVEGELVRITNDYIADELGLVGCVMHVTRRMVELWCVKTRFF